MFADVLHEQNENSPEFGQRPARIAPSGVLVTHDLSDANKDLIESMVSQAEFIGGGDTVGSYRIRTDEYDHRQARRVRGRTARGSSRTLRRRQGS